MAREQGGRGTVHAAMKAVLFDFEGTLVEFQWKLEEGEQALRAAYVTLGFAAEELAEETYATMWNQAVTSGRVDEEELRRRVGPIYDRYDLDALSRWQLRAGAREALGLLKERHLRLALVSNIGHVALDPALERFALGSVFDVVLARDDLSRMKPDPEGIRRCLSDWDLDPGAALFVGDSSTDIRAARAAGVRVAIIAGGESSPAVLAAQPPDHRLDSFSQLPALLGYQ
jgi:HAD superfamily hydrolase (TIGR01509 family)